MTITKADLMDVVRKDLNATPAEARAFVDRFFEKISSTLESGESVKLPKLGVFEVRAKKARPGRNPKTGEFALVPARHTVSFYASVPLKKAVRKVSPNDK